MEAEGKKKLGVTLDVTYASKYISKGGRYFGSKSAICETLDIDLYDTGFGLLVHNRMANAGGFENKQKFKYGVYYHNSIFDDEVYKTRYKFTWHYEHYYEEPRNKSNKGECTFEFDWPELLPGGLVPDYTVWYAYPAGSHYDNRNSAGWLHRFGLGYDLSVPELADRVFHLSASAWYRDGRGGPAKDRDWSHATFGISTKFRLTENMSFLPALYYQSSWEDTVNTNDELYAKLSLRYKF